MAYHSLHAFLSVQYIHTRGKHSTLNEILLKQMAYHTKMSGAFSVVNPIFVVYTLADHLTTSNMRGGGLTSSKRLGVSTNKGIGLV